MGILLAGAMNVGLAQWSEGWRLSYGFNLVFSVALAVLMATLLPESPRFEAMKGRMDAAAAVLGLVRLPGEVQPEMEEIQAKMEEERGAGQGRWSELLAPGNSMRGRTLVGVGLQFFQQVSGINAIMFFAPELFARYLTAGGALNGALVVNALNHAATYIAVVLVDRAGRVVLLVSSGLLMAMCLLLAAVLTTVDSHSDTTGFALIGLSCGFVVAFAYGWGPLAWTVCAEIFPLRLRGKATSVTTAVNWASATAVGLLFPLASSESAMGLAGTFAVFAGCCLAGAAMVQVCLPETANSSLEDVDDIFAAHKRTIFRRFWAKPPNR